MLHKYPNVVPIPGSKNKERIIENLNSAEVELSEEEFEVLENALMELKRSDGNQPQEERIEKRAQTNAADEADPTASELSDKTVTVKNDTPRSVSVNVVADGITPAKGNAEATGVTVDIRA